MYYHILLLIISYIKGEINQISISYDDNKGIYLRNLDGNYKILFGYAKLNTCHIMDINILDNSANIIPKNNCILQNTNTNSYNPIIDYINDDNIFLYSILFNSSSHLLEI